MLDWPALLSSIPNHAVVNNHKSDTHETRSIFKIVLKLVSRYFGDISIHSE